MRDKPKKTNTIYFRTNEIDKAQAIEISERYYPDGEYSKFTKYLNKILREGNKKYLKLINKTNATN